MPAAANQHEANKDVEETFILRVSVRMWVPSGVIQKADLWLARRPRSLIRDVFIVTAHTRPSRFSACNIEKKLGVAWGRG